MHLRLSNVHSHMMAPAVTLPRYVQYPSSWTRSWHLMVLRQCGSAASVAPLSLPSFLRRQFVWPRAWAVCRHRLLYGVLVVLVASAFRIGPLSVHGSHISRPPSLSMYFPRPVLTCWMWLTHPPSRPLLVRALWPMPAWFWRDIRVVFFFLSFFLSSAPQPGVTS